MSVRADTPTTAQARVVVAGYELANEARPTPNVAQIGSGKPAPPPAPPPPGDGALDAEVDALKARLFALHEAQAADLATILALWPAVHDASLQEAERRIETRVAPDGPVATATAALHDLYGGHAPLSLVREIYDYGERARRGERRR